jgi:hypothetical protein
MLRRAPGIKHPRRSCIPARGKGYDAPSHEEPQRSGIKLRPADGCLNQILVWPLHNSNEAMICCTIPHVRTKLATVTLTRKTCCLAPQVQCQDLSGHSAAPAFKSWGSQLKPSQCAGVLLRRNYPQASPMQGDFLGISTVIPDIHCPTTAIT